MELVGGYELSRRFSAKEKVILHLYLFRGRYSDHTLPPSMTQQGMSEKLGLQRPHVSMVLKDLKLNGVVEEKTCHVDGAPRMKKSYYLTRYGTETALDMGRSLEDPQREGLDTAIRTAIHAEEEIQADKKAAESISPEAIPMETAPETPVETPPSDVPAAPDLPLQTYPVPDQPGYAPQPVYAAPVKETKTLPPVISLAASFGAFFLGWIFLFSIFISETFIFMLPALVFLVLALFLAYREERREGVMMGHGMAMALSFVAAYYLLDSGVEPMLPIILTWIAVAVLFLEKNLKFSLKTSAVISLGVFTFLTTLVNLVYGFISVELPLLWMFSGLAFFVLGYKTADADELSLVLPDMLLGGGLSIVVLSAFGAFDATGSLLFVYILWICVGGAMIMTRFMGENVGESVSAIRISLRFSLGSIFIMLGVLFLLAGRGIAGVIQLAVGILVAVGGIKELKDLRRPFLLLTVFMVLASAVTVAWFFV